MHQRHDGKMTESDERMMLNRICGLLKTSSLSRVGTYEESEQKLRRLGDESSPVTFW